ncbi:MAG: ABC transporter substrate-binding protein [bacterium]
MSKFWGIVFILILVLLTVNASEKTISILIGGAADGWTEIAQEFYNKTGIKVNVIQGPPSSDAREIMYSISLLTKTKGFDVIYMDVVWMGKFASASWLTPISSFVNPLEYFKQKNLAESCYLASLYEGEYYSVPIKADAGLLYYRKDLLEKYGYSVPQTWQELKRIAKEIKQKEATEGKQIEGFVFQGKQYEGLVCNFYEVLRGMGYELIYQNQKGSFLAVNEDQLTQVLEFYSELIQEGVSPRSVINFEEEESRIVFQQGRAVFARNWPYAIKMLMEDENMRDKFGVAILPGSSPTLGGWALSVSNYSSNKKEAWLFIDFVVENGLKTLFLKRGDVPTKIDLFQDQEVKSKLEYSDTIMRSVDFSKPRTVHPLYPRISSIIQVYVSGVIAGKIQPRQAAQKMIKELHKVVSFKD